MDCTSPKWGAHDTGFCGNPKGETYGRVLVIREDKTDITAQQVEALTTYFKKVFGTLAREKLAKCRGLVGGRLCEDRKKLMDENASKTKIETFFKKFKEQKIKEGDASWKVRLRLMTLLHRIAMTILVRHWMAWIWSLPRA